MKPVLLLATMMLLFSCTTEREFMADLTDVRLIKIDVVTRYPNKQLKRLTWRTDNNVDYITYESMSSEVAVGDVMKVLTKQ